jgi:hypothetical protein
MNLSPQTRPPFINLIQTKVQLDVVSKRHHTKGTMWLLAARDLFQISLQIIRPPSPGGQWLSQLGQAASTERGNGKRLFQGGATKRIAPEVKTVNLLAPPQKGGKAWSEADEHSQHEGYDGDGEA